MTCPCNASTEERIAAWAKDGIPADLQEMIKMKMRLSRIIAHSHYNGTEIRAAAKMMGVKLKTRYKPLTVEQERKVRQYLGAGRTCRYIAEKMGLDEKMATRVAQEIIDAWPSQS